MKNKSLRIIITVLIGAMVGTAMIGCNEASVEDNSKASENGVSGTVTLSGSSALLPLVEASIEGFNEENPNCDISAQAGGSGTGLTQVADGAVNIGNSDVEAESKLDAKKAKELVDHKVVVQGFAVVVNKELGVTELSKQQIKDIFSGKITNWKDVNGPDKEIMVIHRPSSSGTRATFVEKVLDGKKELENDSIGATQDNNGNVSTAMIQNDGAISYLALSYMTSDEAKDKLISLGIDGVEATVSNITNEKYVFWGYGHMYTKGEANKESQKFIDYITSVDNSQVVKDAGYISIADMKKK